MREAAVRGGTCWPRPTVRLLAWRRIGDLGAETGSPPLPKFSNERDNPRDAAQPWQLPSMLLTSDNTVLTKQVNRQRRGPSRFTEGG